MKEKVPKMIQNNAYLFQSDYVSIRIKSVQDIIRY